MIIKVYSDAACQQNPGPTGLGAVVLYQGKQVQLTGNNPWMDNHEGEFAAAIMVFKYLKKKFARQDSILFYTDSRLLSDSVSKNYSKHYALQLNALLDLMDYFQLVVTQWIPDQKNHGAHHLANEALHQLES